MDAQDLLLHTSELQDRRLGRASLLGFARYTLPFYRPEPVHEHIASRLDAVVAGRTKRLMIFAPPQVGKSQLASVCLPAYWLGRRPDDPVILTSYAASLACSKSRQARALVESGEFGRLFPRVATDGESRSVDHWSLEGRRGALLAAGVGGPIMGHGAALGIIDDPVENWEQAQSESYRERTWEWWQSTLRTRIWEGGAIVLIQTRWHQDDLAGRLLREQSGRWEVLRLTAVAETQAERDENSRSLGLPLEEPDPLGRAPGEPLCPGRFGREELEGVRKDVGSMVWSALYQGRPMPREGVLFKVGKLEVVDAIPAGLRAVRAWDLGATAGAGDFTAGVKLAGPDGNGRYYVVEVIRGRWDVAERNAAIRRTAEADGREVRVRGPQDPGAAGKEAAAAFVRLLAGFAVRTEPVSGSKLLRADPLAAQVNAGNVRLLKGEWNGDLLEEFARFPFASHDDQVDAAADAFADRAKGGAGTVRIAVV